MTQSTRNAQYRLTAFWISGLYALLAALWIYASDGLVALFAGDSQQLATLQFYKGLLFVAVTALLLYVLINYVLETVSEKQARLDNTLALYTQTTIALPHLLQNVRIPALIFGVLAVAIGGAGYLGYLHQKAILDQKRQDELSAIAAAKTEQIANWLAERQNDAQVFASDPVFVKEVGTWLTAGAPADSRARLLRNRLTALKEIHDFAAVALLDEQGQVRLATDSDVVDRDRQALIISALNANRVEFSDLYQTNHAVAAAAAIDIVAPVSADNHPHGTPIAALYFHIDPQQYLFPLIQSWPTPSASAEVFIVRREGNRIRFLNELRHRKNTALTLSLPLSEATLPAAMAARGQEGFVEGLDYRGIPVLAVVSPVPNSPWFLVAKVDAQEVHAPLDTIAGLMGLLVALFITGAGIGLGLWWQQQRAHFLADYYRNELNHQALVQHYDYLAKYGSDIVLLMSSSGQLLEANDSAVSAYGYSHQELVQLNIKDLRAPETLAIAQQQLQSAMRESGLLFETVHKRKDGSQFPVEVNSRLITIQGKRFLHSIIRDITRRKQAELALRESEARYRTLFEQAPDPVLLLDPTTALIVDFNDKAYESLGYTREEFAELTLADIECSKIPQIPQIPVKIGSDNIETKYRTKAGATRDILMSSRTIEINGKPLVQILCHDITERKRIETQMRQQEIQLIQADKLVSLGTLVSGMAHEINNPNQLIQMNAQLLLDEWGNLSHFLDEQLDEWQTSLAGNLSYDELRNTFPLLLQDIADGAIRIEKIISHLKGFVRPVDDMLRTVIDLNDSVRQALVLLNHPIKKKTDHIEIDLAEHLPGLLGNAQQFEQVIVNLVLNALDALPDRTHTIRISTRFDQSANCVELQVEDDGVGIPPEHLQRILEPFFTTKLDQGGTGLGLFITYKLVRTHGGTLSFTSKPGKGTVARIQLPVGDSVDHA